MNNSSLSLKEIAWLIAFVVICQAAGGLGAVSTSGSIQDWYQYLNRPALTPPNWVFGPVWITLYTVMGISLWLVWKLRTSMNVTVPVVVFAAQLLANTLWTPLFFGSHLLFIALITIIVLLLLIVAYIVVTFSVSRLAALLMIPYALWVAFATYLNYGFWQLNG